MDYSRWNGLRIPIFLLLVFMLSACGLAGEPEIVGAVPTQRPSLNNITQNNTSTAASGNESAADANISLALGAQIFAENCTRCHGENGQGDGELVLAGDVGEIRDFTNLEGRADVTPQQWFNIITNGVLDKLMPPWAGSLNASERWSVAMYVYSLAYDDGLANQGETLFDEAGANDIPITVDYSKISDAELLAGGEALPEFARDLDVDQREAVVAYIRTLPVIEAGGSGDTVDSAGDTDTASSADGDTDTTEADVDAAPVMLGTVSGTITNASEGGDPLTGAIIELHIVDRNLESEIIPGAIEEGGTYTFTDVPMRLDARYLVAVEYKDWFFASDFRGLPAEETSLELPVTVYETTNDDSDIVIESIISQVVAEGGTMQVLQIMSIQNTGDRLYVGEEAISSNPDERPTTVGIAMPQGANYLDMTGEGRFVVSPDNRMIYDTRPVMPGEPHVVHLLFNLPYSNEGTFEQLATYPIQGEVGVELSTDGLNLVSEQMQPLGDATMTGTQLFAGEVNLNAGELFAFTVNGDAPAANANNAAQTTNTQNTTAGGTDSVQLTTIMIVIGVFLIAVAIALFWFDRQRKPAGTVETLAPDSGSSAQESNPVSPEANALVREIAKLDLQYKSGEISDAKYQKKRAELKAQLTSLTKKNK